MKLKLFFLCICCVSIFAPPKEAEKFNSTSIMNGTVSTPVVTTLTPNRTERNMLPDTNNPANSISSIVTSAANINTHVDPNSAFADIATMQSPEEQEEQRSDTKGRSSGRILVSKIQSNNSFFEGNKPIVPSPGRTLDSYGSIDSGGLSASEKIDVISTTEFQQQVLNAALHLKKQLSELQIPLNQAIKNQTAGSFRTSEELAEHLANQKKANDEVMEKAKHVSYAVNAFKGILSQVQPLFTPEERQKHNIEWRYKIAAFIFAVMTCSTALIRFIYEVAFKKPLP